MGPGPAKQFDPEVALAAAMKVFWAKGYAAAGISELQSAMGIGRKSLYDTFGGKRALYIKALSLYVDGTIMRLRRVLNEESSALAALRVAFDYLLGETRNPGSCGCFIGVTMAQFSTDDDDVTAVIDHYLARARKAIAQALARAQEAGEITTAASADDLAQLVVHTMQAISLTGRTSLGGTSQEEAIRAIFRLLEAR